MVTRSVSRRAIGALMMLLVGRAKGADNGVHPEALHPANVSKIYVLSTQQGMKVNTYSLDGHDIGPTIPLGGRQCESIAVDDQGTIYVANHSQFNNILVFGPDGSPKPAIGFPKEWAPIAIAFGKDGTMYVLQAATFNHSVIKSFVHGTPTALNIVAGMPDAKGIAIDASGRIWVTGEGNVVKVWDAGGHPVITSRAGLNKPTGLGASPDGKMYIANYLGVGTYLPSGQRIAPSFNALGRDGGALTPTAITVDASGKVYVGFYSYDRDHGRVAVVMPDGKLVIQFPVPSGVEGIAIH